MYSRIDKIIIPLCESTVCPHHKSYAVLILYLKYIRNRKYSKKGTEDKLKWKTSVQRAIEQAVISQLEKIFLV